MMPTYTTKRQRVVFVMLLVLALALCVIAMTGCQDTLRTCDHRLWVKGQVIKTHSWPMPDVTAAEVRNYAWWQSFGLYPNCVNVGVEGMRRTGDENYWQYCYYNPTQDDTVSWLCRGQDYSERDRWNHRNLNGYYTRSHGFYELWTTVYDAVDAPARGSCSIKNGTIGGDSEFGCPWRLVN